MLPEAKITCPNCGMTFWSGVGTLANGSVCPKCGNRFTAENPQGQQAQPLSDDDKAAWKASRPGMELPTTPGEPAVEGRPRFADPRQQRPI